MDNIKDDKVIVMPHPVKLQDIRDMRTEMKTLTASVQRWSALITEINGAAAWIPKENVTDSLFENEVYQGFDVAHKTALESRMGKALAQTKLITVNTEGVIAGIEAVLVKSRVCDAWDPANPKGTPTKQWNDEYKEQQQRANAYEKARQEEYEKGQGRGHYEKARQEEYEMRRLELREMQGLRRDMAAQQSKVEKMAVRVAGWGAALQ